MKENMSGKDFANKLLNNKDLFIKYITKNNLGYNIKNSEIPYADFIDSTGQFIRINLLDKTEENITEQLTPSNKKELKSRLDSFFWLKHVLTNSTRKIPSLVELDKEINAWKNKNNLIESEKSIFKGVNDILEGFQSKKKENRFKNSTFKGFPLTLIDKQNNEHIEIKQAVQNNGTFINPENEHRETEIKQLFSSTGTKYQNESILKETVFIASNEVFFIQLQKKLNKFFNTEESKELSLIFGFIHEMGHSSEDQVNNFNLFENLVKETINDCQSLMIKNGINPNDRQFLGAKTKEQLKLKMNVNLMDENIRETSSRYGLFSETEADSFAILFMAQYIFHKSKDENKFKNAMQDFSNAVIHTRAQDCILANAHKIKPIHNTTNAINVVTNFAINHVNEIASLNITDIRDISKNIATELYDYDNAENFKPQVTSTLNEKEKQAYSRIHQTTGKANIIIQNDINTRDIIIRGINKAKEALFNNLENGIDYGYK